MSLLLVIWFILSPLVVCLLSFDVYLIMFSQPCVNLHAIPAANVNVLELRRTVLIVAIVDNQTNTVSATKSPPGVDSDNLDNVPPVFSPLATMGVVVTGNVCEFWLGAHSLLHADSLRHGLIIARLLSVVKGLGENI